MQVMLLHSEPRRSVMEEVMEEAPPSAQEETRPWR